jgi:hypothetical protein
VLPAPSPAQDTGLAHAPPAVHVCTPSPEHCVAPGVHAPASWPPLLLLDPELLPLLEPEPESLPPSPFGPSVVASMPPSGAPPSPVAAQLAVSVQLVEPPHAACTRPKSAPATAATHPRILKPACHAALREAHGEMAKARMRPARGQRLPDLPPGHSKPFARCAASSASSRSPTTALARSRMRHAHASSGVSSVNVRASAAHSVMR